MWGKCVNQERGQYYSSSSNRGIVTDDGYTYKHICFNVVHAVARYVLFLVRLDSTNFRNPHLLHLIPDEEPKEVVIEDPTTREDVHRFYLMQVLSYGSKSSK